MVTIVRDRIRDLLKSRMTLDQIKAAAPTKGWTRDLQKLDEQCNEELPLN